MNKIASKIENSESIIHSPEQALDFLRNLLKGELLFAEDAVKHRGALLQTNSGKYIAVRGNLESENAPCHLIVETKDCVHANFVLQNQGLKAIYPPYYCEEGLCCELRDEVNNFYLVRECRDYQFETLL